MSRNLLGFPLLTFLLCTWSLSASAQQPAPALPPLLPPGAPVPTTAAPPPTQQPSPSPQPPPGYDSPQYGKPAYGPPPSPDDDTPAGQPYLPPPPSDQGVHLHDGFYLRLSVGPGYLHTSLSPSHYDSTRFSGVGLSCDVAVGNAISDGIILAGRLSLAGAEPNLAGPRSDAAPGASNLSLASLQLFMDIYPAPEQGFHIQAGVGPAQLNVSRTTGSDTPNATDQAFGLAGSVGVGWETWVGRQWALGGILSLSAARLNGTLPPYSLSSTADAQGQTAPIATVSTSATVFLPSLQFTATFN